MTRDEADDAVLDDDAELDDEPTEDAPEDETPEGEDDETPAEDEPSDDDGEEKPEAKTVTLTQDQFDRLVAGSGGREQPPTDRPVDPLYEDMQELVKSDKVDPSVKRVLARMAGRLNQAEAKVARSSHEAVTARTIPEKHLPRVQAIAEAHGLPLKVAYQLYKAELYDEAVKRRTERKSGGDDVERRPSQPDRRGAKTTSIRPMRSGGGPGSSGATVTVKGLKIPKEFASSATYAKFSDSLDDEQRKILLRVRSAGVAGKIRE